jgi:hypothetical protein
MTTIAAGIDAPSSSERHPDKASAAMAQATRIASAMKPTPCADSHAKEIAKSHS